MTRAFGILSGTMPSDEEWADSDAAMIADMDENDDDDLFLGVRTIDARE